MAALDGGIAGFLLTCAAILAAQEFDLMGVHDGACNDECIRPTTDGETLWQRDEYIARGQRHGWARADYAGQLTHPDADIGGVWHHLGAMWQRCPRWYAEQSPALPVARRFVRLVLAIDSGMASPPQWTAAGLDMAEALLGWVGELRLRRQKHERRKAEQSR